MCAATVLKHWREAASLILTHSRKTPSIKVPHPSSSTVVETETLTETSAEPETKEELQVLVLKRSAKSSFMPELYVFPGGTGDDADFSRKWLQLYGATSPASSEERFGFSKTIAQHAPMFYRKRNPDFAAVPSEVAFRISAIRETFEESGVLLARRIGDTDFKHDPKPTKAFSFGKDHVSKVEEWRLRVMRNPTEFFKLCKNNDIVPDIWSLYDWSNWLTPNTSNNAGNNMETAAKRFDAAFFICCLGEEPYVAEDEQELVHSVWVSPRQIMEDYKENRVQLAPPQLYEACRLVNFQTMDELLHFCQSRVGQPLDRWMPVRIQCKDAIIYTFPGDSLYPEKPDVEGEEKLLEREETMQELMHKSTRLHRAVAALPPNDSGGTLPRSPPSRFQLQCNMPELPYGQCPPRII